MEIKFLLLTCYGYFKDKCRSENSVLVINVDFPGHLPVETSSTFPNRFSGNQIYRPVQCNIFSAFDKSVLLNFSVRW